MYPFFQEVHCAGFIQRPGKKYPFMTNSLIPDNLDMHWVLLGQVENRSKFRSGEAQNGGGDDVL
jgi:hypothetical protein